MPMALAAHSGDSVVKGGGRRPLCLLRRQMLSSRRGLVSPAFLGEERKNLEASARGAGLCPERVLRGRVHAHLVM